MNSYELDKQNIIRLVDLITSKMDLISNLDPTIFFDGSEDGGLEDGVTGREARGIKFFTAKEDYFAGKYLQGKSAEDYDLAFVEIINQIKSLDKISHAFLFWIYPRNIIPSHKDDEDPTYRLVISLNEPGEDYGLDLKNIGSFKLSKYQSLGFMAQKIEHTGHNNTDKEWMLLTLCFDHTDE